MGLHLVWASEAGDSVTWSREEDANGFNYRLPSGPAVVPFGDPTQTPLGQRWTWSTPGDPDAFIESTTAEVPPVEDFQVTPSITDSDIPLVINAPMEIQWTAPVTVPGRISLVLGRALNQAGDARVVICRPADDGAFTITEAMLTDLDPTPGEAFGLEVSRSQVVPFCNLGITNGAAIHTLIHDGSAVVP
jgi:hypothetical protein